MARVKIGNIMGPQGIQGIQGPVGSQGPKGDQGVQGQTGSQGPKGATGATGSQGPKGDQGVKGTTGAQGPQGSQGIQGPIGPVGPQGPLPPLVANYLATAAGQGALDAYMGKLIDQRLTDLMNKYTQLNGELRLKISGVVGSNDPVTTIKNHWAGLPDGCYCLAVGCGAEYGAVVSRINDGAYGSVLVFGYQEDFYKIMSCRDYIWDA